MRGERSERRITQAGIDRVCGIGRVRHRIELVVIVLMPAAIRESVRLLQPHGTQRNVQRAGTLRQRQRQPTAEPLIARMRGKVKRDR